MQIKHAVFVKSAPHYKDCPDPSFPEYAFIGRSNVGKSSLINIITGHKKLAKTSSTPGKTQLINHFLVNDSWYLTDLPGLGFAKVSKSIKVKWERMIQDYLLKRVNLVCAFLLIDSRHKPLKNDMEFIEWLGAKQIPFTIVFTKVDKLGSNALKKNIDTYLQYLQNSWDPLPPYVLSSSSTGQGRDEILSFIDDCNNRNSVQLPHDTL
jgi:GTP-binding protein